MTALKLAWRMQRWELLLLIGGVLVMAAAALFVAWQTPIAYDNAMACVERSGADSARAACPWEFDWAGYLAGASTIIQGATTVVPFAAGVLLGAPLISREIEKRTAPIAWSLSPSRIWWLAGRILPVLLAVVLVLLLLGQGVEAMILAEPESTLGFDKYAMHGPLVAARGLAVFVIGTVVGLLVGRVLPAILLTGLFVVVLLGGLSLGRSLLMQAEATWIPANSDGASSFTMIYGSGYIEDATGTFVSDEQAAARFPDDFDQDGSLMPPGLTKVYRSIAPEMYPLYVAREMAALLMVSIIVGAVGLWVIRWRRPETS